MCPRARSRGLLYTLADGERERARAARGRGRGEGTRDRDCGGGRELQPRDSAGTAYPRTERYVKHGLASLAPTPPARSHTLSVDGRRHLAQSKERAWMSLLPHRDRSPLSRRPYTYRPVENAPPSRCACVCACAWRSRTHDRDHFCAQRLFGFTEGVHGISVDCHPV